jgi:ParB family chromosome partitioning protein
MERLLAFIGLNEVLWEDERFAIPSFVSHENLKASLHRCHLLSPPWLWAKEDGKYVIVDGFKRLHWLKEKARERLECFVFPEKTDPAQLLLRRIEAKLLGPLNMAEKAQIIFKLAGILEHEEILTTFFPVLNIPPRPDSIEKWCRLAAGSEGLLEAIAVEDIGERPALELIDWEEGAPKEAISILRTLRCSVSIQMEILERVTEVALGQNKRRSEILSNEEIQQIVHHPQYNHRQKTQLLRNLLYRWRFPRLKTREERFEQELAEARLPSSIRLIPPRFFEGEQWQLQISFQSPRELQELLENAENLARSSRLRKILEPTSLLSKNQLKGP